jgi:hypothetical protein
MKNVLRITEAQPHKSQRLCLQNRLLRHKLARGWPRPYPSPATAIRSKHLHQSQSKAIPLWHFMFPTRHSDGIVMPCHFYLVPSIQHAFQIHLTTPPSIPVLCKPTMQAQPLVAFTAPAVPSFSGAALATCISPVRSPAPLQMVAAPKAARVDKTYELEKLAIGDNGLTFTEVALGTYVFSSNSTLASPCAAKTPQLVPSRSAQIRTNACKYQLCVIPCEVAHTSHD